MISSGVALQTVCDGLDAYFRLADWPPDPAMSRWVPRVYGRPEFDYPTGFEPSFCTRFNGLMLRSSERVSAVFCAAFPSPDVLQRLLDSAVQNALLFVHHPVDMEVGGLGFLPIAADALTELRRRGISIYSCHAPLDCTDGVGTNAAIAEALDLKVEAGFSPYGVGLAGRICTVGPLSMEEFQRAVRRAFATPMLQIGGQIHATVDRVAVVAGGGDDMETLEAAESRGCQVYLTGEWYPRSRPADPTFRERLQKEARSFMEFSQRTAMTLVGVSHVASEQLVMATQAGRLFEQFGLQVVAVAPQFCWR
jgi:putative NIF3 family GTP cyclohydrolase 1 type 2